MQRILNNVAMANSVAPAFLEFVGIQDERHTVGKLFYHFTIMDPTHRCYKSTVAFLKTDKPVETSVSPSEERQ